MTEREKFLQAECDRMVDVVARAREVVRMTHLLASTPAAVKRCSLALEDALKALDQHR